MAGLVFLSNKTSLTPTQYIHANTIRQGERMSQHCGGLVCRAAMGDELKDNFAEPRAWRYLYSRSHLEQAT
jgi:hypothetical protein